MIRFTHILKCAFLSVVVAPIDGKTPAREIPKVSRTAIGVHAVSPGRAASTAGDSTFYRLARTVYFPINKSHIPDTSTFVRDLRLKVLPQMRADSMRLVSLRMRGAASPDGPLAWNTTLSGRRLRTVLDIVAEQIPGVEYADSISRFNAIPEDYTYLVKLMRWNNDPATGEVEELVNKYMDSNVAGLKRRLKAAYGGRLWRRLLREYFPALRSTRVLLVFGKANPKPAPAAGPVAADTATREEPAPPPAQPQTAAQDTATAGPLPDGGEGLEPIIAIKNNLLYDAALAPNLEIERWWGKDNQWSVMAEWQAPWYTWRHNSRAYQILNIGLEGRRWLQAKATRRRQLTGMFAGIYLMSGKYDLQWRSARHGGFQGEYFSPGITLGYAHRIARRWNMEYSVGVGYLYTDYRHYHGRYNDKHLIWQHDGQASYFGPTKAKVSLVYLLCEDVWKALTHPFKGKTKEGGGK